MQSYETKTLTYASVAFLSFTDFVLRFPKREVTNYAQVWNMPSLSAFTVCFWMKSSGKKEGVPFSYAVPVEENELLLANYKDFALRLYRRNYRAFSLTWPASMQMYWNKRKRLHKKRVQLLQDWFGTRIWPPWRHVKTPKRVFSHDVMSISAILCGVPWQWNGGWDIGVANPVLSFVPRKFA